MAAALIRVVIIYVVIIFSRLMGKRQIGELQTTELVITILLGNRSNTDSGQELSAYRSSFSGFSFVFVRGFFLGLKHKKQSFQKNGAG